MIDYHVHVCADGEYAFTLERVEKYVEQCRLLGISEIGISEHHEVLEKLDWKVLAPFRQESSPAVRIALEIGYEPGMEADINRMISGQPYDYIIGSLHFIDGWAFDHPDYRHQFEQRNVDQVYSRYYELLEQLVESSLFDVIGHLDVVKKWGHRPADCAAYRMILERLLKKVQTAGMVIEINSAGLRKPVAELYPSPEIIALMYEHDIPICLGSDAHRPEEVGMGLDTAATAARRAGYRKIISFERRQRKLVDLA